VVLSVELHPLVAHPRRSYHGQQKCARVSLAQNLKWLPVGNALSSVSNGEYLIVRSSSGISSPTLTGIGYIDNDDRPQLCAHPISAGSYFTSHEGLEIYTLYYDSQEYWAFPFHQLCWELLESRIYPYCQPNDAQLAGCLFNVLYCTPLHRHLMLMPGHDYYGAGRVRVPYSNFIQRMRPQPHLSHLFTHPYLDFRRYSLIPYVFEESALNDRPPISTHYPGQSWSDFTQLPSDILWIILAGLSSKDVCSFRLSSRVVASISSRTQLPQSFWASRFGADNEMAFVSACCSLPKVRDWRSFYFSIKDDLQSTKPSSDLSNKHRIWKCLGQLSYAIKHMQESQTSLQLEDVLLNNVPNTSVRLKRGPMACGELLEIDGPGVKFEHGCRNIYSKVLNWPQSLPDLMIHVSFTQLNSRRYVSGLRVSIEGVKSRQDISRAGVIVPSEEQTVCFNYPGTFAGIEVAAHATGIVGLNFLVRDFNNWHSHPIGDFDTNIDIGTARLLPSTGSDIVGLLIGLDVCLARPPSVYCIITLF
jgi:hypothetical protein